MSTISTAKHKDNSIEPLEDAEKFIEWKNSLKNWLNSQCKTLMSLVLDYMDSETPSRAEFMIENEISIRTEQDYEDLGLSKSEKSEDKRTRAKRNGEFIAAEQMAIATAIDSLSHKLRSGLYRDQITDAKEPGSQATHWNRDARLLIQTIKDAVFDGIDLNRLREKVLNGLRNARKSENESLNDYEARFSDGVIRSCALGSDTPTLAGEWFIAGLDDKGYKKIKDALVVQPDFYKQSIKKIASQVKNMKQAQDETDKPSSKLNLEETSL